MNIKLNNINKFYSNKVHAVKDVSFEIKSNEFVVLLGPSGCGKSTLLRMIAGLEEISSGELYFGDKQINGVPPKARNVGMVFQNYALYPHMTVYENLAFPMKVKKFNKSVINNKVLSILKMVDLEKYSNRKPKELSGGQRQRVALGRAIAGEPNLYLYDEPLSNLDADLRVKMRHEIKILHNRMKKASIYVTHDQTEALTMADKIVILKEGIIQQIGTNKEIYNNPQNLFVAQFIGQPKINVFEGEINNSFFLEKKGLFSIKLTHKVPNTKATLGIRPHNIKIQEDNQVNYNKDELIDFDASAIFKEFLGQKTVWNLQTKLGHKFFVEQDLSPVDSYSDSIRISFSVQNSFIFDNQGNRLY